jgi:nucleoside 2-deoxyribosyltransferase
MKIYIAASWKHQHAVEMLTALLRERNHEVLSFVEKETQNKDLEFEEWIQSPGADVCFEYDTTSAMIADMVIYVGPSGKDAAAELGMAYAKGVPIVGLYAKGEDFGLMRKMMHCWCERYTQVLDVVEQYQLAINWKDKVA